jgi:hypothetical protein
VDLKMDNIKSIVSFNQFRLNFSNERKKIITILGEYHQKIYDIDFPDVTDLLDFLIFEKSKKVKIFLEMPQILTFDKFLSLKEYEDENIYEIVKYMTNIGKSCDLIRHDVILPMIDRKIYGKLLKGKDIKIDKFKYGFLEGLVNIDIESSLESITNSKEKYDDVHYNFLMNLKEKLIEDQKYLEEQLENVDESEDIYLNIFDKDENKKYYKLLQNSLKFHINIRDFKLISMLLKYDEKYDFFLVICGQSHSDEFKRILENYLVFSRNINNDEEYLNIAEFKLE